MATTAIPRISNLAATRVSTPAAAAGLAAASSATSKQPTAIKTTKDLVAALKAASDNVKVVQSTVHNKHLRDAHSQLDAAIKFVNAKIAARAAKKKVAVQQVMGNLVGEMMLRQMEEDEGDDGEQEIAEDEIESGDDEE